MIAPLQDALTERGYDTLTDVQTACSNPDLEGKDLLVSAQTGSGKTVGFGLAIAPTLLGDAVHMGRAEAPVALVIAPTRELALQVKRELTWLYAKTGAWIASCVGGMDMREERRALSRGAHIVVGTPGRLRDHIERGSLQMDQLKAVVLDEADEMLDLGFREDLEFMLGEAPEDRRTLMFSATVSPMIAKLAKNFQNDAERISTVSGKEQHADITYQAVRVAQQDAEHGIINILRYHEAEKAIVFANTRAAVNRLTARFSNRGFAVVSLSGELSQNERTHALQAMRDGRARVCVATDVAARGIDLPKLELVIHADLPTNTEALLHRSGRTGRAGQKGISALVVTPKIAKKAERLLKWAKLKAEWVEAPSAEEIMRKDEERLLTDPVWTEETSDEQKEFSAKLLELHTPETIAAAYLKLYQSRKSAPEELADPNSRPERKERKERAPFGPSTWFSVSAGRKDRAEARWLLPLVCRAGDITKDSIGAIRVQEKETFVELAQPAVAGFLDKVGDGGELEEGMTIRKLDKAPDLERGGPRGPKPGGGKPFRGRDDSAPRGEYKGKPKRDFDDRKPKSDYKPRREDDKPREKPHVKKSGKAVWGGDAQAAEAEFRKPRERNDDAEKPASKGPRKEGGKPFVKSDRKPDGKRPGKPGGKPGDKPFSKGPGGKPGGKPFAKGPGGKPSGKPKGKPGAASSSKRLGPPRKGGDARPTRKK
ncbi:DEAD/DEAH box helicase [uncultured Pelagimonas sp.]|uniref:DEAD/DEAH box helicase n=1 Tax=uncultured Pelagimonas sp. TaxID=1618102 RepID=UPI00261E156F|nr:DEAD/DEAH box helicase [uncultured Pelagimonas sp.]